jgi:hypothetical protein
VTWNLYRASKKKENVIKIFEERKKCHGPFCENAITAAKCLTFKGISLFRRNVKNDCQFVQMLSTKT